MTLNSDCTQVEPVSLHSEDDAFEVIGEGVWRVGSFMTTAKSCTCGMPSCWHRRIVRIEQQNLVAYAASWEQACRVSP